MGSFANSLFKIMLGWLQGAVSAVWSAFINEKGNTIFNWIGRNWILIACVLCVIGLAVDLCVYIFRWKPFKVWKSYFSRNKETEDNECEKRETVSAEKAQRPVKSSGKNSVPKPESIRNDPEQEPDFSQWEAEKEEGSQADSKASEKPVTVTGAGYIIPEDSPYRRPSVTTPPHALSEQVPEKKEQQGTVTEQNPVTPRRRRRISVTEFFSDPEEDLRQFDAPQHIIDSRKAYREPVYPHGWQKSEEKEE